MTRIKLVRPTIKYKNEIMDYKNEFIKNGESMDGTGGLRDAKTLIKPAKIQ